MNNVYRANLVGCLAADPFCSERAPPYTQECDWAHWDLQHDPGCKHEVKPSAAHQPGRTGGNATAGLAKSNATPRTG